MCLCGIYFLPDPRVVNSPLRKPKKKYDANESGYVNICHTLLCGITYTIALFHS